MEDTEIYSDGPEREIDELMSSIKDMKDLYFISQLMLAELSDSDSKFRLPAELMLLLDRRNLNILLNYYEGETIRIPTREEFHEMLQMMIIYYNIEILHRSLGKAMYYAGIKQTASKGTWTKYTKFRDSLSKYKLPNVVEDINE